MTPLRPLALLAALALFAGCLGGDEDATPAMATPTPHSTSASTSPEAGAPSPEGAVNDSDEPVLPEPVDLVVSFDGKLDNEVGACEFNQAGQCVATPTGTGSSAWMQDLAGSPTSILLEMTWQAATPATQTLVLVVVACPESEEGHVACELIDRVEGSSPLTMEATHLLPSEAATLHVWGYMPSALPESPVPGAWVWYEVDQPFHVEGIVTVQPAASEDDAS